MGKRTNEKECYCRTCKKELHYLGVAMHRKGHRLRKESCEIIYTDGTVKKFDCSKGNDLANPTEKEE